MAKITGQGIRIPDDITTNHDMEKLVETSDEWITTRTGIKERRLAAPGELTSHLAARAAEKAVADAGLRLKDIDLIITATVTPDHRLPACSCEVQSRLGLKGVPAFDLCAACSGFIYGLEVGSALADMGRYRNILLICAETLSSITDWTDRSTCVLFGDGAGAVVIQDDSHQGHKILSAYIGADGSGMKALYIPGGGGAQPFSAETLERHDQFVKMNGQELFKVAVRAMVTASKKALKKADIDSSRVNWVIPHQANMRILNSTVSRLGVDKNKLFTNLEKYGNTSAASIPLALMEARDRFNKGDIVLCPAFGGGLTWGAAVIQW